MSDARDAAPKRFSLVRRREIWVPTLWGWIVLLLAGAIAATFVARNLHAYLSPNEPVGARILVVEGWMDTEGLDQAAAVIRAGGYERIVTTGGPVEFWPKPPGYGSYAELAADYLAGKGVAPGRVTAVPSPEVGRQRTYLSAVLVREWARQSEFAIDALDVFSWGPHARRTRMLYRLAFGPDVEVGVYAAHSSDYDGTIWWRSSIGAKEVLEQSLGLIWQKCFFWPALGSGGRSPGKYFPPPPANG